MTNPFKYAGMTLILASLAACGGGGDGTAASDPTAGTATADRSHLLSTGWLNLGNTSSWFGTPAASSGGTKSSGSSSGGSSSSTGSSGSGTGSTPPSTTTASSGTGSTTPSSTTGSSGTGTTAPSSGSSGGTAPAANSQTFPQSCVSKGGNDLYLKYGSYQVWSNIWNAGSASSYTECVSATIAS
ncbi:MAG: hypothetical protein JSR49_07105, partial [Proteobacteria bacterium]|nr:hypothetical protein [Pseudomonadota bacterium]